MPRSTLGKGKLLLDIIECVKLSHIFNREECWQALVLLNNKEINL